MLSDKKGGGGKGGPGSGKKGKSKPDKDFEAGSKAIGNAIRKLGY